MQMNKSSTFLNRNYAKLLNIQSALMFWTTSLLVLGYFLVDTDYSGIPYIWVIGIPFIILLIILRRDCRYEILMVDSNKFDCLNQAIQQLRYLVYMLNYYRSDDNTRAVLDGFVDYHRTICKREDCPCQRKNMNQKKIKKFIKDTRMASDEKIKDEFVVIVYIIERIYVLAITRFPNCTELRINHALFLLDKMKSTQQALIELELAESQKPALDESFMIYRYKKLIDEDILESRKNQNNAELMAEVTLDTHIKEIQQNIEKSTIYYIEFWSQLNEETPDLSKLYEIGTKLNLANLILRDNWKKITKMNIETAPNLLR